MSNRLRRGWAEMAYWALWGVAVVLYLAWPLTHLGTYAWSNDEGLYVQRAALANAGYPLYTEILFNKPPLFVWILQAAFRVAGRTLAVARLTSLCTTLLGFIALGAVSRLLWGRWAGLASVALLLGLPEVPARAHAVMSDLPAMAFALVALATMLSYRWSGRRIWAALSGAALAASLLIHPLLIYMALPLTAVLFLPSPGQAVNHRTGRPAWLGAGIFLGVGIALGLLVLAAIDRRAFFTWAFHHNVNSVGTNIEFAGPGKDQMIAYLKQRWPLVWLALLGTAALLQEPARRIGLLIAVAWLVATGVTLAAWSPVWKHYMLFLALPLVVVAGGGLAHAGRWAVEKGQRRDQRWWLRTAVTTVMLTGVAAFAAQAFIEPMPQPEGGPEWSPDQLAARAFLENAATPDGFVVTDNALLAFTAGRLVPPALTEASYRHIRLGYLTSQHLVESVLCYKTPAVLFATGRLDLLPPFEHWVSIMASERRDFGRMRAYRLNLPTNGPGAIAARLDGGVTLSGYSLSGDGLRAGDALTVTLFWSAEGPIVEDYTVFVHLVDEAGRLWGQHDGTPLMGAYPTGQWPENLLLPDPHAIAIDPGTPPGGYAVFVGLYRRPSLDRVPAYTPDGSRWPDDRIELAEVNILHPSLTSDPTCPPPLVGGIISQAQILPGGDL